MFTVVRCADGVYQMCPTSARRWVSSRFITVAIPTGMPAASITHQKGSRDGSVPDTHVRIDSLVRPRAVSHVGPHRLAFGRTVSCREKGEGCRPQARDAATAHRGP